MNSKNREVAFPNAEYNMKGGYDIKGGMTMRDYFAAKAIIAFIDRDEWQSTVGDVAREVAFHAYAIADAMLEERKK